MKKEGNVRMECQVCNFLRLIDGTQWIFSVGFFAKNQSGKSDKKWFEKMI